MHQLKVCTGSTAVGAINVILQGSAVTHYQCGEIFTRPSTLLRY